MPLARELIDTIMQYFCPRCGTAVERRGASFMAVTHLRCASCGQDAKFTYSDKLALFEGPRAPLRSSLSVRYPWQSSLNPASSACPSSHALA